jgi:hypothetical protein
MSTHKSGRHHLGGGGPQRASQRRRQTKASPRPMLREGDRVVFRGVHGTFIAHDGGDALIWLRDRRWSVPLAELR